MNVTSVAVFHTEVTVNIGLKQVNGMIASILWNYMFTSVHLNNNNCQINLFNSHFELLIWEALDYICKGEYQTEVDSNPQHNSERN